MNYWIPGCVASDVTVGEFSPAATVRDWSSIAFASPKSRALTVPSAVIFT
jgi:hypothetical protein